LNQSQKSDNLLYEQAISLRSITFFGALGLYFIFLIIDAILTGIFIPKSPQYPLLREEKPILFWIAMIGLGYVSFLLMRLCLIMFKEGPVNTKDKKE